MEQRPAARLIAPCTQCDATGFATALEKARHVRSAHPSDPAERPRRRRGERGGPDAGEFARLAHAFANEKRVLRLTLSIARRDPRAEGPLGALGAFETLAGFIGCDVADLLALAPVAAKQLASKK